MITDRMLKMFQEARTGEEMNFGVYQGAVYRFPPDALSWR